jgi:hypothetical protein
MVAAADGQEAVMRYRAASWVLGPLLVLAAGASTPGSAANTVDIVLHGAYFSEPATVQFTVAVEPNEANRTLRIEVDSGNLYRASEIALSGGGEKRLHSLAFKNLTAGHYALRAEVRSSTAVRGVAMRDIRVIGAGRP